MVRDLLQQQTAEAVSDSLGDSVEAQNGTPFESVSCFVTLKLSVTAHELC